MLKDVIVAEIKRDVTAARERDPAAQGVGAVEILLCWPGVQAILAYRVAHALHRRHVPLVPRMISTLARSVTGVEIHPAAEIGPGCFIDHGMGVVIGETTEIGTDVTLYQGVTLGGTGFAAGKRHPTIEDDVTIGSGAKLLGAVVIGAGAKIGANTVVIHDVPAEATVVGIPGHAVRIAGRKVPRPDADWDQLPDPVADAMRGFDQRISSLERVASSERLAADQAAEDMLQGPAAAAGLANGFTDGSASGDR
jgi:serine O-acetyltransferase